MEMNLISGNTQARWFGTGGWRALIAEEFTKANVQILSQAIADDMRSKGWNEIVIGYDRRFLSDRAALWAANRPPHTTLM